MASIPEHTMPNNDDALPAYFADVNALDEFLARPSRAVVEDLATVEGDIIVLGAGGKMGPTLTRLAKMAARSKRVVAVARFSEPGLRRRLDSWEIETISCDLTDRAAVDRLPRLPNVVFMAGRKFGSSSNEALTWAINVYVPAIAADAFRASRIVVFSTGNVYSLTDVRREAPTETTPANPAGEYAQSCLGRERVFEYFSQRHGTRGRALRLNYAIDKRYGILYDIATKVRDRSAIDVTMGYVNMIWQGDANSQALRCLKHCTAPISPLNISGHEKLSVRWLSEELGRRLGRKPIIAGIEAATALLTNTSEAVRLFGAPRVPIGVMLDWVADWVARSMPAFDKPTKFEVRDGVF
jgi:hypothetical protein